MKKRIITIVLLVVMTLGMFTTMAMAERIPLRPDDKDKSLVELIMPPIEDLLIGLSSGYGSACQEFWNKVCKLQVAYRSDNVSVRSALDHMKYLVGFGGTQMEFFFIID